MAYLDGFDHDIFISFAHVDNQDGWVSVFHQHLTMDLARLLGRPEKIKIWFDKDRLEGGQLYDKTIEDALGRTAVLVALTSRGYFHPESYCHKEIRWFSEKARRGQLGLSVGDRSRIFNVPLTNLPFKDLPQDLPGEFSKSIVESFHDAEENDQVGDPIDQNEKSFQVRMRKLSKAIFHTVEAIKKNSSPSEPSPSNKTISDTPAKPTYTIFLADTSDSLRRVRNRVAEELQRQNIVLAAPIPPPFAAAQHEESVVAEINHSILSVHLFDQWEGRAIEGLPEKTYPQRQAELALEHAADVLIWVPQTMDVATIENIEDESHRAFLQQLESRERKDANYEFLRESKTEITRQILARIEQIKKRQQIVMSPTAALLDSHRKDQLHAIQIFQLLIEGNVQPYLNPEDDDPRSNLKILEERLKQVSKLILFFGAVAEDWVRARLAEALKIAVEQRCPLKTLAVCFVPPHYKEEGISFSTGFTQVHHFNLADIHDPNTLKLLLGDI